MSWQASKAVNYNSTIKDRELFRLLHYLADWADENGRIDPAPNQSSMAEFSGVSTRTIRTWINKICDTGELEQTRVGSGPGNPSAYQIHLEMVETKGGSGSGKAEESPANPSAFDEFKAEIKAEISSLKAEINQLKAERWKQKGGKVEAERRKGYQSEDAHDLYIDPDIDLEKDIYIYNPLLEQIQPLRTALSAIVRETDMPGFDEKKYIDTAEILYGRDASPDDVQAFGDWWAVNGWHSDTPVLKNVVNNWGDFLSGKCLRANSNGSEREETTEERLARLFPDEVKV